MPGKGDQLFQLFFGPAGIDGVFRPLYPLIKGFIQTRGQKAAAAFIKTISLFATRFPFQNGPDNPGIVSGVSPLDVSGSAL